MRTYETIIITKPDVAEAYLTGLVKKIDKAVGAKPGEVIKKTDWGLKRLAYEIGHQKKGHYLFWSYQQEPSALREIERHLKVDENVLRYMTVCADEAPAVEKAAEAPEAKKPRTPRKKEGGEA